MSDEAKKYWDEFLRANPSVPPETPYQVWYFGDGQELADELAALVVAGKKTATASLLWEYETDGEATPQAGGYSVITRFEGQPVCILQTTEVRVLPFEQVGPQFAADEGEGDLSLDYWREAPWRFFGRS